MNISNQKPVDLSPIYRDVYTKDFDPHELVKSTIVAPLFTPLVASANVTMSANGHTITDDEIVQYVFDCCDDAFLAAPQTALKTILAKTLVSFDDKTNLSMRELFAIQSAVKAGLDEPDGNTIYTPSTDVIPVAKKFLAGQTTYDEWFATMAYYTRSETLAFYFSCENTFEDFKAWLTKQHAMMSAVLPQDTNTLVGQFLSLSLKGLTESLKLRNDSNSNNDPSSFARYIVASLMDYTRVISGAEFGCMPFDVGQLFIPENLVFINVERHAKATAKEIADEWNLIKQAAQMPIKMVSNKKLQRLTAKIRSLNKIKQAAALASRKTTDDVIRAANLRFRKTAPTTADLTRYVRRVISKMETVAKSENSYKSVKMSFQRPNRRDPDDFNKMGKMVSVKYKPDIHLYVDTSGSISERNYQDAIKACIIMAKKLNVNLYFNSFSHIMSQTTHLRVRDKSIDAVYREFQRIPKVSGGTDYEQIWNFIKANPKRKRELSLLITDFEYTAPNHSFKHPINLYYAPCSHMNYDAIKQCAEDFCRSMMANDPKVRKHLLF